MANKTGLRNVSLVVSFLVLLSGVLYGAAPEIKEGLKSGTFQKKVQIIDLSLIHI